MDSETYTSGALIVGGIAAAAIWLYSMSTWGFLIGLLIGWLPAAIGGLVIGLAWPVVLVVGAFVFLVSQL